MVSQMLELDEYEAKNLRAAMEVLKALGGDTGDWWSQIYHRIPATDGRANASVEDQLKQIERRFCPAAAG